MVNVYGIKKMSESFALIVHWNCAAYNANCNQWWSMWAAGPVAAIIKHGCMTFARSDLFVMTTMRSRIIKHWMLQCNDAFICCNTKNAKLTQCAATLLQWMVATVHRFRRRMSTQYYTALAQQIATPNLLLLFSLVAQTSLQAYQDKCSPQTNEKRRQVLNVMLRVRTIRGHCADATCLSRLDGKPSGKNTANRGRQFWTCIKHHEDPECCGFFKWVEPPDE